MSSIWDEFYVYVLNKQNPILKGSSFFKSHILHGNSLYLFYLVLTS